jgi:FdhE protein
MRRADGRARRVDEIRAAIAEARRADPESGPWLDLLDAAVAETETGRPWHDVPRTPATDRPADAPLLHGLRIEVDVAAARRWVRRLLDRARGTARVAASAARRLDVAAWLEAALRMDDDRIEALARAAGTDPAAARVLGHMAAWPLLHRSARALEPHAPHGWWHGVCPVCGAWPAYAEYRGLERRRWCRCGRCGTGWEIPWLRCPYCATGDHERLGYLAPENEGESHRRVEVCYACRGYLKAFTTVRPTPAWAVLLEDARTLHLDLAALDRGYRRPQRPRAVLDVRVVARRRAWRPRFPSRR